VRFVGESYYIKPSHLYTLEILLSRKSSNQLLLLYIYFVAACFHHVFENYISSDYCELFHPIELFHKGNAKLI
jgi:hypothetical protein